MKKVIMRICLIFLSVSGVLLLINDILAFFMPESSFGIISKHLGTLTPIAIFGALAVSFGIDNNKLRGEAAK